MPFGAELTNQMDPCSSSSAWWPPTSTLTKPAPSATAASKTTAVAQKNRAAQNKTDAGERAAPAKQETTAEEEQEQLVCDWGRPDAKLGPKGQSLQAGFARFRAERKREHKLRKPSSELVRAAAAARAAAEAVPGGLARRDAAVRKRFIETAMSYVGVPYAERCVDLSCCFYRLPSGTMASPSGRPV